MKFNVRYNSQVYEYDEQEYNPQNFGTKRLNIRVNSTSTMKFGLTTNTNGTDYSRFKIRVGGRVAYIARTLTTSYISGNTPNYNNSSVGSRSQSVSTLSGVKSSVAQTAMNIQTSSMSTKTAQATEMYTGTAGSGVATYAAQPSKQTVTNATGSTVTTNTALYSTVLSTSATGSGASTSAADPTKRTVTNATGSSVTIATASANIVSRTWYSFSSYSYDQTLNRTTSYTRSFPAVGNNKVISSFQTRQLSTISRCVYYSSFSGTVLSEVKNYFTWDSTSSSSDEYIDPDYYVTVSTVSTTRVYTSSNSVSGPASASHTTVQTSIASSASQIWGIDDIGGKDVWYTIKPAANKYVYTYSYTGSVATTSKKTFVRVRSIRSAQYWGFQRQAAIQTYYSSSKRWSYTWNSSKKYTKSTYNASWTSCGKATRTSYFTSMTSSTTSVTETIHNIDL